MAAIDIQTTQHVTIEYELASLRERFFAFFIDLLIFYALYIFTWLFLLAVAGDSIDDWGFRFLAMMNIAGLIAYHLLSEVFANGRSFGKKALNMKVVRLDGREPGLGEYLMRSLFLLIDFILSMGVLGALLIGSTFRHQRLGDIAANTTVVRMKNQLHFQLSDILNIQSIEDYQPEYPEVRQLNEADMLLIKNVLTRYKTWRNPAHAAAVQKAVEVVCSQLNIAPPRQHKVEFLKTLIRDYIVLTR